jgi:hypothetical protein
MNKPPILEVFEKAGLMLIPKEAYHDLMGELKWVLENTTDNATRIHVLKFLMKELKTGEEKVAEIREKHNEGEAES